MSQVIIKQVEMLPGSSEGLASFGLNTPRPGQAFTGHALDIVGWVAVTPAQAAVRRLEVTHGHELIRQADANLPRPDLVANHKVSKGQVFQAILKEFPRAAQLARQLLGRPAPAATRTARPIEVGWLCSGFQCAVSTLGLPAEFELKVTAVLDNGDRVLLASLRGQRQTLSPRYQPRRQPVILTHLGRSGSTWLAHLLAEHPDIVVHRRYPHELNAAVHAMRVLHVMTTPANAVHQPDMAAVNRALDRVGALPLACAHDDPRLSTWLRREYIERQADFCLQTIDGLYDEIAASQHKPAARYFSEKMFTFPRIAGLVGELYAGAKEVFLVRDFRDTLCSRQSFHTRRGRELAMKQNLRNALRNVEALSVSWRQRGDRAHLVRYEELVLQPAATLTSLFRYLEIDHSTGTIAALLKRASQESLQEHITAGDPVQSIGRWRRDLPREVQGRAQRKFRDSLRLFGYLDDVQEKRAA